MAYLKGRNALREKLEEHRKQLQAGRNKLENVIKQMEQDHKPVDYKKYEAYYSMDTKVLENAIVEIQKARDENIQSKDCVLKMDFVLREIQDRIREIVAERKSKGDLMNNKTNEHHD